MEGGKPKLTKEDIRYLLSHTVEDFAALNQLLGDLGVESYGFFEVTPERLFMNCGSPHPYALVLSVPMALEAFESAPSIICQHEVANVFACAQRKRFSLIRFAWMATTPLKLSMSAAARDF